MLAEVSYSTWMLLTSGVLQSPSCLVIFIGDLDRRCNTLVTSANTTEPGHAVSVLKGMAVAQQDSVQRVWTGMSRFINSKW